jgi:hypothetical protein
MEAQLNIIILLLLVLIAVNVSRKARLLIGKLVNFSITSLGWIIVIGITSFSIWMVIVWATHGWEKVREANPKLWSFPEILLCGGCGILVVILMNIYDSYQKQIQQFTKAHEKVLKKETWIAAIILIVGSILTFVLDSYLSYHKLGLIIGIAVTLLGYIIYLVVKYRKELFY